MKRISVHRSAIIEAPIEKVWAVLRDFNSHHQWHPAVTSSKMENGLDGDVVGGVRRFTLSDGKELREQLLSHSDRNTCFSYCILDSPLPLFDYVATVNIKPVTDGEHTFWNWRSQFRVPDDQAEMLENLVGQQVYEAGFTGLRLFLAENDAPQQLSSRTPAFPESTTLVGEGLPSKAIIVETNGGPDTMLLVDSVVPPPGPGQVLIRQSAVAVNYLDIKHRMGVAEGMGLPGTPGMEGVGEIIDIGKRVHGLFPGDRVAYMAPSPGAYTEVRCIDADDCIPLPDGITDLEASTLLKGVTAGLLLNRVFRVVPGGTIMIQTAAGGLGHLLCQWARSIDLTVIGTVSTSEKSIFSRNHGCDYPIMVDGATPLYDEVMRITNGRGVDHWVHSGDTDSLKTALNCMAPNGEIAFIGDRSGQTVTLDVNALKRRSLTLSAPVCFHYLSDPRTMQRLAHHLFTKIQGKAVIPAVQTFPLSEAADAHRRIEDRRTMGSVVLVP